MVNDYSVNLLPMDRNEMFRSRVTKDMFSNIVGDVDWVLTRYGLLETLEANENPRSRFVDAVFYKIVRLFGNAFVKPLPVVRQEGLVEQRFLSLDSVISIVFIQVTQDMCIEENRHYMNGQVIASCEACAEVNSRLGVRPRILAILYNGLDFWFFAYDPAERVIYRSPDIRGTDKELVSHCDHERMIASLKYATEYLFDYFVMAYINGVRAYHAHYKHLQVKIWQKALNIAEEALQMLRMETVAATSELYKVEEPMAEGGVELLKQSVAALPHDFANPGKLGSVCDGKECLEKAMSPQVVDEDKMHLSRSPSV